MLLNFNWVDFFVILFLILYATLIFRRGFIAELFEFIGFSLSLTSAVVLSPLLASVLNFFLLPQSLANTLAFLILWVGAEFWTITIFRDIFKKLPMAVILSKFNRYAGIVPNLAAGVSIVAFVGVLLIVLPTPLSFKANVIQSRIIGSILPLTASFNKSLEVSFSETVRAGLYLKSSSVETTSLKLNFPDLSVTEDAVAEKTLFNLVNDERSKLGLSELAFNKDLANVARQHSQDMFGRGYFGHIDPDGIDPLTRVARAGINFISLGENISYAPDTLTAHASFMNSTPHRANILNPRFVSVGVGVVDSGSYGSMFTELFAE